MAAEHTPHAPVRLLIAESSENAAHEFDSTLRDAGIATRLRVTDLTRAPEDLPTADLMLCNAGLPQLERRLGVLKAKAPHVPIILVNPAEGALTTAEGMRLGAADVVPHGDPETLVLVFRRELAHVCQAQRLRELDRALEEAEQRCQLLLQSSRAAIAYVHEGMHIHANAGYLELFGYDDPDALIGVPLMDLMSEQSGDALKQELRRFRQDGEERHVEFVGRSAGGDEIRGSLTLAHAEYEGEPCMQVMVRAAAAATANGADAPAQAPSPAAAETNGSEPGHDGGGSGVGAFLARARDLVATGDAFRAVVVAEVDGFRSFQERLGLRSAEMLGGYIQSLITDFLKQGPCGRLSPHQFVFTVADDDRAAALARLEGLRSAAESLMMEIDGKTERATVSIGGAELDDDADDDADGVLEAAVNAAFAAALNCETDGGNRVELLSREVAREKPGSEAGRILAQINEAIDGQHFLLLFQPIISLRGDADEHYEVFLRMVEGSGEHVAPNEFLRTAVEHGVAAKIDRWVILQSIKMLSTHRSKGHNTRLTINVTANSIQDPEFLQWLGVAIKAARLPSDAVIFQVTEQDAAGQVKQTREFVEGLRAMHCRASLSRYGLADNATSILEQIPADFVKLDGSHVERLMDQPALKDELTAMIRDLQSRGKLTIIPMVESAGVLSALWQAGANYIQGHYLQEPTTEMDFDFSTE
ncbi:MAG: EAL domain-containing protein [Pseudomonadota bacterium]